jgi:helicase
MHSPILRVEKKYVDATINIALDTLARDKQALIFVGSKRGAEKVATDVSGKLKIVTQEVLAEKILNVLSHPTEQCRRLSEAIKKGIAFHHAGLAPKQKELIEDGFREGTIKIISCTPTLAAGLDMPAFRTVIRDLKRYTGTWGMQYIPVLEYQQMAGRAGRPGKEDYGEAICIARDNLNKDKILNSFLRADVEPIYSKLAVEPVLRTYILSLVASGFVDTISSAKEFFGKTFWAFQYGDMHKLETIIQRVISLLRSYGFLEGEGNKNVQEKTDDFQTGTDLIKKHNEQDEGMLKATRLGERVAQLYLDPLTAYHIMNGLNKNVQPTTFAILQLLSNTLEMRPLLPVRVREAEAIEDELVNYREELLQDEPTMFENGYQEFLNSIKTSLCLRDWLDEAGEDLLLERYGIRPGELRAKLSIVDWLTYCASEISKVLAKQQYIGVLYKLRTRLKYGVKEELLPLLRFKNVGRVRSRTLFREGIHSSKDIKAISTEKLSGIIGKKLAESLKIQADATVTDFSSLS